MYFIIVLKTTFQFLIGTLKTLDTDVFTEDLEELFQFLIGTLKTLQLVINNPCQSSVVSIPYRHAKNSIKGCVLYGRTSGLFQFLIGTLKTFILLLSLFPSAIVSIPYRHAKNTYSLPSEPIPYQVSIPYRHAKNCLVICLSKTVIYRFNSL